MRGLAGVLQTIYRFHNQFSPTRAFFWLKAATIDFTFKTLLRHYAKLALTVEPTVKL